MGIQLLPHLIVFKWDDGNCLRTILFTQNKDLASELGYSGFSPWFEPGFWQAFNELGWSFKLKRFTFSFMGVFDKDVSKEDFEEEFRCITDVFSLDDHFKAVRIKKFNLTPEMIAEDEAITHNMDAAKKAELPVMPSIPLPKPLPVAAKCQELTLEAKKAVLLADQPDIPSEMLGYLAETTEDKVIIEKLLKHPELLYTLDLASPKI